jgi:SAM-dependent methyltransferase
MGAVPTLPVITGLDRLTADEWLHVGEQLRSLGLGGPAARELARAGAGTVDGGRRPLRLWHLRRSDDPLAALLRMFAFGDPVAYDEAAAALGGLSLPRLVDCGLLVHDDGGVVSPLRLSMLAGMLVLGDEPTAGGDAVMGAGQTTTALCQASYPVAAVGRVLDLGCGGGGVALCLADRAESVVASDINPRALELARHNAALNGIGSVQFRQGDLFDAVGEEKFDLVVAQPPFIPLVDGASATTYLHGGRRGDELALRTLAGIPAHLVAGGGAVMLAQWPIAGDVTLERRVRAAVASDEVSVLVLRCPPVGLDDYCAERVAWPDGGAEQQAPERMREHLEAQGTRAMQTAFVVIRHAGGAPIWTSGLDVPGTAVTHITSARIERFVRARIVLAAGEEPLLAATLRPPAGALLTTRQQLGSPDVILDLELPDDALCLPTRLDAGTLAILEQCAAAPRCCAACWNCASGPSRARRARVRRQPLPSVHDHSVAAGFSSALGVRWMRWRPEANGLASSRSMSAAGGST